MNLYIHLYSSSKQQHKISISLSSAEIMVHRFARKTKVHN